MSRGLRIAFPGSLPAWVPSAGGYIEIGANAPDDVGVGLPTIDNWISATFAKDVGDFGAVILHGAGHPSSLDSQSTNNGVYQFLLENASESCLWSCIKTRTPLEDIPEGALTDEFGAWDDGQPAAAHTYDHIHVVPASVMGNTLGSLVQVRLAAYATIGGFAVHYSWFFDIAAQTWEHSTNAIPENARAASGNSGSAVYDPTRGCFWFLDTGNPTHIGKLDLATKTWTSVAHGSGSLNTDGSMTGGYCPASDCCVWWWAGGSKLIVWDCAEEELTWDATQSGTPPPAHVGLEWCPHPSIEKFYGMAFIDGDFYPDPTAKTLTPPASLPGTWAWGSETFAAEGGAGDIGNDSLNPRYNSLRWMNPDNEAGKINAFIWANALSGPVNILRPAAT